MLIISIVLLLSSNSVSLRRDKSILFSRVSITILFISSIIGWVGCYLGYLAKGVGIYGGLFFSTSITQIFQIFLYIISAIILQLSAFQPLSWKANGNSIYNLINKLRFKYFGILTSLDYFIKNNKKFYTYELNKGKIIWNKNYINPVGEQFEIIEYSLILLFILSGASFLVSSSDLVSIFLSIELQSYGLYLLSTIYRNSESATNAGLTYFLLGGLSSCFILLGTSLLYANSGTTNLDGLYVITSISDAAYYTYSIIFSYKPDYIDISLLVLSIGFLFKVSAAPFHFWSPDVYDAIPTIVTTFVAIIAKISIFIFLLELVHYTSNSLFTNKLTWTSSLLFSSLLSLIVGTVVGLTQLRIKRLLAYSTISHVGFILLALSINSIESIQAFIFYIIQYSLSNLNAFLLILAIGFTLTTVFNNTEEYKELSDKNNSPIQLTSQLKGYFLYNPLLALSLAITIFSFVGIPPLTGFFAKQMVLSAALDSGYLFLTLVGILTSVISAVYYLNIIKQIFFDEFDYSACLYRNTHLSSFDKNLDTLTDKFYFSREIYRPETQVYLNPDKYALSFFSRWEFKLTSSLSITISILTLFILLFIFMSKEILSMANILALNIFNP